MEILSRMLDKACDLELLRRFKLYAGGPTITLLLYAKDVLLFDQALRNEARIINQCLQIFSTWSG